MSDPAKLEWLERLLAQATREGWTTLDLQDRDIGPRGAEVIAKARTLSTIATLYLRYNGLGSAGAKAVASAEHLGSLVTLGLGGNHIGDAGAAAIARSDYLTSLRYLYIGGNDISPEGARAIAEPTHLASLTTLDLSHNNIGDEGARAIADATHLASLTTLDLSDNDIGNEGARAIADATHLASLTTLELPLNRIGDEGARAIAKAMHLASLTTLDLGANKIGDEGARAIAEATHLTSLKTLNLCTNGIGDDGIESIAKATHLATLMDLDIRSNRLGPDGVNAIARATHLTSLARLILLNTNIGDFGAIAIAGSTQFASLMSLELGANSIGDDGAKAIAEAKHLASLRTLCLRHNNISNRGVSAIASATHLRSVNELNLSDNDIGDEGTEAILNSLVRGAWREMQGTIILDANHRIGLLPAELRSGGSSDALRAFALSRPVLLNESKVILLGNGRAGKTHLLRRLFSDDTDVAARYYNAKELPTHGINTLRHDTRLPGHADPVVVRAYDFGGQLHLHATHRLYLSDQRSVFIVACEASGSIESTGIRYWLRMIAHEAGRECPVIVALTKTDETLRGDLWEACKSSADAEMTADALSQETGARVIAILPAGGWAARQVDPDDQHFTQIRRLREAVLGAVRMTPGIANTVPPEVIALRNSIEARWLETGRPSAKWMGENDLFNKSDTVGHCYMAIPEALRPVALSILQSLGVLHALTERRSASDGIERHARAPIFNPAWVQGPTYRLLWARPGEHDRGVIDSGTAEAILATRPTEKPGVTDLWERLPFTAQDRDEALRLLLNAEIAFNVGTDESRVIPSLFLPDLLDDYPEPDVNPPPGAATRKVLFGFLRPSTLSRLMGRRWRDIVIQDGIRKCWRQRVEFDLSRIRVVVAGDLVQSTIRLWTSSKRPARDHVLDQLVNEIYEIQPPDSRPVPMPSALGRREKAACEALAKVLQHLRDNKHAMAPDPWKAAADELDSLQPGLDSASTLVDWLQKAGHSKLSAETTATYHRTCSKLAEESGAPLSTYLAPWVATRDKSSGE